MNVPMSKQNLVALGFLTGYSIYTVCVCMKYIREGRKEREKIQAEKSFDLKAICYAGEEVSRRIKNGEYEGGEIRQVLNDLRFFEHVKGEQLRDHFKDVL